MERNTNANAASNSANSSAKEKLEQEKEQQRVDLVCSQVRTKLDATRQELEKAHHETSSVERNYGQNAKINTFEVDDQMETNAEVQQQKALVSKNVLAENILKHQVATFTRLKDSPYFGRIDIQDPDEDTPESLYIGTSSFINDQDEFMVYDWRAPISSIYYNGTLGPVKYETPMGEQKTELTKKRQFKIKDGVIQHMFDTNETVGDDILQSVLGEHSDAYMKNIVATIQQEQNTIIRDTKSDLLLVQGVAGSGKTSAILQRIAFLLYHSRTKLSADQIVLFSPNLLFSNYISEVLPSLGERNMRQVILAEFFAQRLQGMTIETLFDRYESSAKLSPEELRLRQQMEDPEIMSLVKKYADSLRPDDLKFSDLVLGAETIFTASQIRDIYAGLPQALHAGQKLASVRRQLQKMLEKYIRQEARAKWAVDEVSSLTSEEYHDLMGKHEILQDIEDVENYLAQKIVRRKVEPIFDAIYNNFFLDFYAQYQDFLRQNKAEAEQHFAANLEYHRISLSDCAPLLYLRDLLTDLGRNHGIKHLFIDEMQDYTLPQLIYLKYVFPNAKLTLLGDSEQALFNAMQAPRQFLDRLHRYLGGKNPRIIQLKKSYRSTQEITDFMRELLPDGDQIQSFTRHGSLPKIIVSQGHEDGFEALEKELTAKAAASGLVALIAKDQDQAEELYSRLHGSISCPLHLLKRTDRSLPTEGVIILPIYLAKGLEFDDVVAFDISAASYGPDDAGILYTICSRAMHALTLIACGQASPLLKQVDPKRYTIQRSLPAGK